MLSDCNPMLGKKFPTVDILACIDLYQLAPFQYEICSKQDGRLSQQHLSVLRGST